MIVEINIEENPNVKEYEQRTFMGRAMPIEIKKSIYYKDKNGPVHLQFLPDEESFLVEITGWHNGQSVSATALHVEDSGDGDAWLIYGGNEGIRLRRFDKDKAGTPFSLENKQEWGELYLYYHKSLYQEAIEPFLIVK